LKLALPQFPSDFVTLCESSISAAGFPQLREQESLSILHKSELFSNASDDKQGRCVERPFHGTNLSSPRNRLSCPEGQRVSRSEEEALHHIKHAVLIIWEVKVSDRSWKLDCVGGKDSHLFEWKGHKEKRKEKEKERDPRRF
jgi:hypothetical protein